MEDGVGDGYVTGFLNQHNPPLLSHMHDPAQLNLRYIDSSAKTIPYHSSCSSSAHVLPVRLTFVHNPTVPQLGPFELDLCRLPVPPGLPCSAPLISFSLGSSLTCATQRGQALSTPAFLHPKWTLVLGQCQQLLGCLPCAPRQSRVTEAHLHPALRWAQKKAPFQVE